MIKRFRSLVEMLKVFPDEQACIDHLTSIRWRNGEFCPHCGGSVIYHFKDHRSHKCAACRQRFSIKVGTIFEDSKISLQKWFMAIYLITSHKKGISSIQLSKDIAVTQKTAWFMMHRLREASNTKSFLMPLKNEVEVDETYIGGKERNKHVSKRVGGTQGRNTTSKTAAVALVERGGEIRTFKVEDVTTRTLNHLIANNVALGSKLFTDDFKAYTGLAPFYTHRVVKHGEGEYVIGDVHVNTAEGFFSQFKRGLVGIYHLMSKKHLHRYLNEFAFRYNMRAQPNGEGFTALLSNIEGRLPYKVLTANEG